MNKQAQKYDTVGQIMAYESGELNDGETIELFQHLLDDGLCWRLQGHYGRVASELLKRGLIKQAAQNN